VVYFLLPTSYFLLPTSYFLLPTYFVLRSSYFVVARQLTPRHRYFTSRYSSIPYLEPSRPMPDSFIPPNGATSVEIKPVLIPTMPYSSASATRQIRPISRP